jgi:hypothetical protein
VKKIGRRPLEALSRPDKKSALIGRDRLLKQKSSKIFPKNLERRSARGGHSPHPIKQRTFNNPQAIKTSSFANVRKPLENHRSSL